MPELPLQAGDYREWLGQLKTRFPQVKGFSKRNLEQIRRWHGFWSSQPVIAKQAATQLFAIPWWHNVLIVSKCTSHTEALYYLDSSGKKVVT